MLSVKIAASRTNTYQKNQRSDKTHTIIIRVQNLQNDADSSKTRACKQKGCVVSAGMPPVEHPTPSRNKNLDRVRRNLPFHLLQRLALSLGDALLRDRVRRAEFLGEEAHTQLLKHPVHASERIGNKSALGD